ncbi:MAG: pyridoxamine 5'-phosphate oxidase family protein [Acidobacteriota bacterium]
MRRNDKAITDPALIEHILSASHICRLAMVDQSGEPYLVPLNYACHEGALFFHSAAAGRKIDILRAHPRVCFEIESGVEVVPHELACEWTTKYRCVIGYGRVEFIEGEEEKRRVLELIMAQHGKPGPNAFKSGQVRSLAIMKLTIDELTAKQSGDWNE